MAHHSGRAPGPSSLRLGAVAAWVALLTLLVQATLPAQRGPEQEPVPCFRTEVPPHRFDIILGRPTERSVTASVLSYSDAEGYVEWGTQSGSYPCRTMPVRLPAGEPVETVLQPLEENTAYWYRVRQRTAGNEFGASDEYRFQTPRPPGSTFTFTVIADSHLDERTNAELYTATLRSALADNPDFHIDLGDTFMCDKVRALGRPIRPMYLAQRYYLGILCSSAPLFFVTGNHDGEIGGEDPQAVGLRRMVIPGPASADPDGSGNYYAFTWGDALFIVLDPFTYTSGRIRTAADSWNRTLGEAQYRWLQQTLEQSEARLKFVFIHHLVGGLDKEGRGGVEAAPYFEWGGHDLDGAYAFDQRRPGWGRPIHELLAEHQVSAVFHGHDHFFARQELDGVPYQECPQPGWIGGERVSQAAAYGYRQGTILPSSGHLRVTVSGGKFDVTYVRSRLPAPTR